MNMSTIDRLMKQLRVNISLNNLHFTNLLICGYFLIRGNDKGIRNWLDSDNSVKQYLYKSKIYKIYAYVS